MIEPTTMPVLSSAVVPSTVVQFLFDCRKESVAQLRRSGTESEYGDREHLMEDVFTLYETEVEEAKAKSAAVKVKLSIMLPFLLVTGISLVCINSVNRNDVA